MYVSREIKYLTFLVRVSGVQAEGMSYPTKENKSIREIFVLVFLKYL